MRFIGTGLLAVSPKDLTFEEGEHVRKSGKWFFVNTRRMEKNGELPEPVSGEEALKEPVRECIRRAVLFIDLGSTRTLGIVVKIPNKDAKCSEMECQPLDLVDYAENNDEAAGPFSSQVVLERRAGGVGKATWPLSEVRTGKAARELYLFGATSIDGAEGRGVQLMASSPKRMFAQMNPDRSWRTIGREHEPRLESYSNPEQGEGAQVEGLVPSRLVGMQVVELLEQAERMLNSREETHAYRVDEVHVTYPPGWLGPVQEIYQRIIQAEVDRWARARALEVKVEMGCSEALGALVFHWYNQRLLERRRGSPSGANRNLDKKKLGVVDVGGGTSDLLLEEIAFHITPPIFEFKPVCWQSEETAGDELVKRVAVEIVLPTLIEEGYQIGEHDAILKYLQGDAHAAEKRLWMRRELQPLAQCVAQAAERGSIPAEGLSDIREHLQEIAKQLDKSCKKSRKGDSEGNKLTERLVEAIPKKAKEKVPKLAEDVFKTIAERFAEICQRHGCTEVRLSGKAMDYAAVKDVFEKALRAKGIEKVGLLVDQEISDKLVQFLGRPSVRDSKYATVWGSICKWLLNSHKGHFAEGWDIRIMDVAGRPKWYLHEGEGQLTREACAQLEPVENGHPRNLSTLPMALSYVQCKEGERIGANEDGAAPVRMYKLELCQPDMSLIHGSRPSVQLEITPKGEVHVTGVEHGRVQTGAGESDLLIGDLAVTLDLAYAAEGFWLDLGKVKVELDGASGGGGGGEGTAGSVGGGNGGGVRGPEIRSGSTQKPSVPAHHTSAESAGKTKVVVKLGKSKKGGF